MKMEKLWQLYHFDRNSYEKYLSSVYYFNKTLFNSNGTHFYKVVNYVKSKFFKIRNPLVVILACTENISGEI